MTPDDRTSDPPARRAAGPVLRERPRQDARPSEAYGSERDPRDDVATARQNVRHAGVTYGPRDSRRLPRDVAADWLRTFIHRYGWRAYALPVLVIVTIAALATTTTVRGKDKAAPVSGKGAPTNTTSTPPLAGPQIALKVDPKGGNYSDTVLAAAALPSGGTYTTKGTGSFRVLPGTSPKVGTGQLFRYSIDVENGITGVDLTQFQNLVVTTLADPRSWSGHGVALQRVDSGRINFHVSLTSSMTVRKWCGYDIPVETSCYTAAGGNASANVNRVVFNVSRWVRGSTAYLGDLNAYRVYMVNHEDGHALGHNHAHQCLPGGLAPVMMQQTFGLRSTKNGALCEANPWPFPVNATGAPGAEQPDTAANNEYGRGD